MLQFPFMGHAATQIFQRLDYDSLANKMPASMRISFTARERMERKEFIR